MLITPALKPADPSTLIDKAASLTEIIGSKIDDTTSNSMVIGQYCKGSNLPQFSKPLNGLKETVLDCPGGTVIYVLAKLLILP